MDETAVLVPCTLWTIFILFLVGVAIWAIIDRIEQREEYDRICDEIDELIKEHEDQWPNN